jgi:hypothetical protein
MKLMLQLMITKKYHYNSNALIISCDIILYKYRIKKVTVKIIESLRFFDYKCKYN